MHDPFGHRKGSCLVDSLVGDYGRPRCGDDDVAGGTVSEVENNAKG